MAANPRQSIRRLLGSPGLWAALYAWIAYALIFRFTRDMTLGGSMVTAFHNVAPLLILGFGLYRLTLWWIVRLPPRVQVLIHALGAPAFGLIWYIAIQLFRGVGPDLLLQGFEPKAFALFVIGWQVIQGLFAYAAIVAFAYAARAKQQLADAAPGSGEEPADRVLPTRLLVRCDNQVSPVDFDDILYIQRAGDYSEIVTRTGAHLSNRSLSELEDILPGELFIRVHRSTLVNMDAVVSGESAGNGRMTVHLQGSHSVQTSRSGRQLLMERMA